MKLDELEDLRDSVELALLLELLDFSRFFSVFFSTLSSLVDDWELNIPAYNSSFLQHSAISSSIVVVVVGTARASSSMVNN